MYVTGLCKICGAGVEDEAHALAFCPHARRLWSKMRECWRLPQDNMLQVSSGSWFRSLVISLPAQMIDHTGIMASVV
jgi:hypothetical protein